MFRFYISFFDIVVFVVYFCNTYALMVSSLVDYFAAEVVHGLSTKGQVVHVYSSLGACAEELQDYF